MLVMAGREDFGVVPGYERLAMGTSHGNVAQVRVFGVILWHCGYGRC